MLDTRLQNGKTIELHCSRPGFEWLVTIWEQGRARNETFTSHHDAHVFWQAAALLDAGELR